MSGQSNNVRLRWWVDVLQHYVESDDHTVELARAERYGVLPISVDPENIKTAEQLTKERFSKYGPRVNLESTLSAVIGYLLGIGSVAGASYFQEKILDGSGGGGSVIQDRSIFTTVFDPVWLDVVVMLV